jgi:hypothetical protein
MRESCLEHLAAPPRCSLCGRFVTAVFYSVLRCGTQTGAALRRARPVLLCAVATVSEFVTAPPDMPGPSFGAFILPFSIA